jgi:hypothetical protein
MSRITMADVGNPATAFNLPKCVDNLFFSVAYSVPFHLSDSFLVEPDHAGKS